MRPSTAIAYLATSLALMAASCSAHIEMVNPPARNSKYLAGASNIDYNNMAPLGGDRTFPCAGKGQGPIAATVVAGNTVHVRLYGSAYHDGGHCQFSLSYDGGRTFVVINTVYRECLRAQGLDYYITIPPNAPSAQNAIFAWSWLNAIGNREYYMNCADVTIRGTNGGSITGPQLLVINIAPSSVVVPEFGGSNQGPIALLNARPTITVSPGSVGPGVFTGEGVVIAPVPVPAPAPAPVSAVVAVPVSSSSSGTTSSSSSTSSSSGSSSSREAVIVSTSSSCNVGALQCLGGRQFRQCAAFGWTYKMCPTSTVCKQAGAEIICGWP